MDFDWSEEQAAIVEAVEQLLAAHAGPARAMALGAEDEVDEALAEALGDAGFLGVASGEGTGALEAAAVVERVARAAGVVSIGAEALVAPALLGAPAAGPVALAARGAAGPVRYVAQARSLLLDDGEIARHVMLAPGEATPVRTHFGFPLGRLPPGLLEGESLGPGSGERLRSWWRVALAAELAGSMAAALDITVAYVKGRRQFGRAIGSFQAVQHRLAQCAVEIEASRWLAFEAAHRGAPAEAAATAAAYATAAAARVHAETHQLTGAMGFTREHDLHVFSMRLQALRLEAGGVGGHRIAAARARWADARGSAR